jgi:PhzF family phenazine biosynthesis protein
MSLSFYQVDVFTVKPLSGNPAAVVFGGAALEAAKMQAIAGEMNLSETVFVLPPSGAEADYRVRIFTPRNELPFAGHPTIATAHAVIEEGRVFNGRVPPSIRQECGIGIVPVSVQKKDSGLFFLMTQAQPQWLPVNLTKANCAAMLGCREEDLLAAPVEIVSTGVKWLIIPLAGLRVVERLEPDMALIERLCKGIGALGVTVFCLETEQSGYAVHARTFAPGAGVLEDPVCGSGQGSIAAYIAKHGLMTGETIEYFAEQGLEIQRPGSVSVKAQLEKDGRWTVQVGGQAVTVIKGEMAV